VGLVGAASGLHGGCGAHGENSCRRAEDTWYVEGAPAVSSVLTRVCDNWPWDYRSAPFRGSAVWRWRARPASSTIPSRKMAGRGVRTGTEDQKQGEMRMKKLIVLMFAGALCLSLSAMAQDMAKDNMEKKETKKTMKAEKKAAKSEMKAEKKDMKSDMKSDKKEMKSEMKADKSDMKADKKEMKSDMKGDTMAAKGEMKAAKHTKKAAKKEMKEDKKEMKDDMKKDGMKKEKM
jgi:hypothetical protein